ncbi:MAG: thioredoxin fold domain-containing protein [Helicobacteraceae bacterium]|nr:thioredoxin fold domain-containing protein [Helicobacteraceae bacterium]
MQTSFLLSLITSFLISLPLYSKDLDLNSILNQAAKKEKVALLFFHKPNCGYCDHMIEFTLNDSEISKKINDDFVFIDIYIEESGQIRFNEFIGSRQDFAKHIGYDFYPTTAFIDSTMKIVHIAPGMIEQDDYLKVLNYISTKQYREVEFQTYLDTLDFDTDF